MNGESVLNEPGYIVYHEINTLKNRYLGIHVDTFVVMPNHVHAIIVIEPGRTRRSDPTNFSLADVIRNIGVKYKKQALEKRLKSKKVNI